ncbi:MAG: DUF1080 domain-containing protein [Planctomycetes bacterium]|nr:DUF1080 domain-containing protein [Planctomycetota bacterium]
MRHVLSLFVVLALAAAGLTVRAGDGKTVNPFNGTDLKGWKIRNEKNNKWVVGQAVLDQKNPKLLQLQKPGAGAEAKMEMVNDTKGGGSDIYTEQKFGDCRIEAELMIPQGSNSGIYVMGEYEVQVFDSFGKEKLGMGDMGALYSAAAPKINACKKPGEWQKFVIDFQAPRFEDGKRVSKAKFLKVVLNDQVIHANVEMNGPTPSCLTNKEAPTGPVMLQGDHGPVSFRNIRITPK